jgi:hypothetical protein
MDDGRRIIAGITVAGVIAGVLIGARGPVLSTVSAEPIATFARSGQEVADALEPTAEAASTTVVVTVESQVPVDSSTTTTVLDPNLDPNAATTTVTTIEGAPPQQPTDSVDIPLPPVDSVDIPTTYVPDPEEPVEPTAPPNGGTTRATLRVVIANADSSARPDLENATLATLNAIGYGAVTMADDLAPIAATIVYFRDGFNRAAFTIATDLQAADVSLLPMPEGLVTPLTSADDAGDVIVLLGPDVPG